MLILTRRIGESLRIGKEVTVSVLGIKGNQARLGITAPKTLPVHREEVYRRLQQEQAQGNGDCREEDSPSREASPESEVPE